MPIIYTHTAPPLKEPFVANEKVASDVQVLFEARVLEVRADDVIQESSSLGGSQYVPSEPFIERAQVAEDVRVALGERGLEVRIEDAIRESSSLGGSLFIPGEPFVGRAQVAEDVRVLLDRRALEVRAEDAIREASSLGGSQYVPAESFIGRAQVAEDVRVSFSAAYPPHINDGYIESTKTSDGDWDLVAWFDMYDLDGEVSNPTGWLTGSGSDGPNEVTTSKDTTPQSQGGGEFRFDFSWTESLVSGGTSDSYIFWLTEGTSSSDPVVDCETISVTHPSTAGNTNSTSDTFDNTQETNC